MGLRCFLFSPDEGTANVIRRVLTDLGVEADSCPDAGTAGESIAQETFHLVIIDWDQQPEASMLLTAARERKPAERPLTLAIVSDDISVPKALQAGANSILRRPILMNQVKDTLTTARDLLRARMESTNPVAQAAAAAANAPSKLPANMEAAQEKTLRAGEFLQSAPVAPGGQFETEAEVASFPGVVADTVGPLKDLEPVAAPMPVAPPPLAPEEPRTLEELLKSRGVNRQAGPPQPPQGAASGKPELLGYDQTPSYSGQTSGGGEAAAAAPAPAKEPPLFSYITGESEEPKEPKQPKQRKRTSSSSFRLSSKALIFASILAGCAIVLAPQAPWHPQLKTLWSRGQRSLHAWLNPPLVTTPVAPAAHETFSQAGDEYKLPVAENIPDATTDPSQIRVVPVVDPTAKKNNAAGSDQPAATDAPTATPSATPADGAQTPAVQVPDSQPPQTTPTATPSATTPPSTAPAVVATATASPAPIAAPATTPQNSSTPAVDYAPVTPKPSPAVRQPTPYVPPVTKVPSSLQTQMATMVPDASGNKSPDAAMPSIEPVDVPELTERALLTSQPQIVYPAAAGVQQGTVVVQVLVGRDGTVQDVKFLQGSLAFARAGIDGVRQWKFKPYIMNGRPVSVQTKLTINFQPGH